MKCPRCTHRNPPGVKFCSDCGQKMGTLCSGCNTLNLAARLCSLAKPGGIMVGPETYRQTIGYFNFDSQEPVQLKGLDFLEHKDDVVPYLGSLYHLKYIQLEDLSPAETASSCRRFPAPR